MKLETEEEIKILFKTGDEGLVKLKVTNFCGADSDSVYVQVNNLPVVDLGNDTVIKYNTRIYLDTGGQNYNFLWQDGSSYYDYEVDYPGTYWVEVWDELGCKSSDTIPIEPIAFEIKAPNAFSPNGDNINDDFGVF